MQFTREIHRLLVGILFAFGVVAVTAAYWAVMGPDTLAKEKDNPRLVEAEAAILRGSIVDRNGELLVTSIQNEDRTVTRQYLYPEANSALGYFSLRYGVSGAEAAYNTLLRGDDIPRDLSKDILHLPQIGSDIRLTFDLNTQRQVLQAMGERQGAVVVLAVPSGEVLALVSLPTYDPNTLDTTWDTLKTDLGNPFFNRVLQGSYQPGGMLQTPLMAAALLTNQPLENPIDGADAAVNIDKVTLNCGLRPPSSVLTLQQAYVFACPSPFAQLVNQLGSNTIEGIFDTFHVNEPPTLPGFVAEPISSLTPTPALPTPSLVPQHTLLEDALGQGQLTVTPLGMVMITAAILNDGNSPQPYTLLATRLPQTSDWLSIAPLHPTIPMVAADVALQLQVLMQNSVQDGAAQAANRPGLIIGGHASLAYSGEGSQAWFIGFAKLDELQGVVVAVVLENSNIPGQAANIGGTALAAASHALQNKQ